jgi:hypothetical protein
VVLVLAVAAVCVAVGIGTGVYVGSIGARGNPSPASPVTGVDNPAAVGGSGSTGSTSPPLSRSPSYTAYPTDWPTRAPYQWDATNAPVNNYGNVPTLPPSAVAPAYPAPSWTPTAKPVSPTWSPKAAATGSAAPSWVPTQAPSRRAAWASAPSSAPHVKNPANGGGGGWGY